MSTSRAILSVLVGLVIVSNSHAQSELSHARQAVAPMALGQTTPDRPGSESAAQPQLESKESGLAAHGYREVSDFFNIREANPQVDKGEWEFEVESRWFTRSNHHDDEFGLAQSLKFGITDDIFAEIEVIEPNLGDGANQGPGDINLVLFNRFVRETDVLPAIGGFVELRLPTGDGSSGVDASFNAILTKSITDKFRVHLEGYVETANGGTGAEDENRRNFQWGIGPGFDYSFDEKTLALVNYINRSSEERGGHNENVLEFGFVRELARQAETAQHFKIALDVGLDGQEETPNLGVKAVYSIDWK